MNRSSFLKTLGLGSFGLFLPKSTKVEIVEKTPVWVYQIQTYTEPRMSAEFVSSTVYRDVRWLRTVLPDASAIPAFENQLCEHHRQWEKMRNEGHSVNTKEFWSAKAHHLQSLNREAEIAWFDSLPQGFSNFTYDTSFPTILDTLRYESRPL